MCVSKEDSFSCLVVNVAGDLENQIKSNLNSILDGLSISGNLNDDDIAYLGKYLKKESFIHCLDLAKVIGLSEIDHNSFEDCVNLHSIVFPASITRIGEHAFDGCKSLISIKLPESVEIIGNRAFSGCISLTSINIPSTVSYIGVGSFYGCFSLLNFNVEEGNPKYSYEDNVLFDSVDKTLLRYIPSQDCKEVNIPSKVVHIGNYAFDGCKGVETVIVNEGCTDIGERAFVNCEELQSIILPSSLNNITYNAFEGCTCMNFIEVSTLNPKYAASEGVLYSKDMTYLMLFPKAKMSPFDFPPSITKIYEGAFAGCTNIHSLILPAKLNHIHNNAFNGCENLIFISLPKTLKNIGRFAFADCTSLSEIWINSSVPPKCDTSPFAAVDMNNCLLKVPLDSEISYRNEYGWDVFKHVDESFNLTLCSAIPPLRYVYKFLRKIVRVISHLFK